MNSSSFLQLALRTRYQDICRAYPSYFTKLDNIFKHLTDDTKKDIKKIQDDYLNKNVKQMKTKLKIFVKSASNLIAKDSCGTSDPYVTIQCGFSKIKKTKTQKKNLNPVWNETIEFEYYNTADGISGEIDGHLADGGHKLVIRLWDEDVGIKAQLDKMLTNEADDFLGQVILDLNDLNLSGEHNYNLKPRSDGHLVTGFITLSISLTSYEIFNGVITNLISNYNHDIKSSHIDQYRALHKHIFDYIKHEKINLHKNEISILWLFECIMSDYKDTKNNKIIYFKDFELNLIIKQFCNKYVINEIQKQMIHLECFYYFFIDNFLFKNYLLSNSRNKFKVLNREQHCQIYEFMGYLINVISSAYSIKTLECQTDNVKNIDSLFDNTSNFLVIPKNFQSNIDINENFKFLHETCLIPNKLALLLSNYRRYYSVKILKTGDLDKNFENENSTTIKEMQHTVIFFSLCCNFIQNNLLTQSIVKNRLNSKFLDENNLLLNVFNLSELKQINSNSIDFIKFNGYCKLKQFETILKCIEISLITNFNHFLFKNDFNFYYKLFDENEDQKSTPHLSNEIKALRKKFILSSSSQNSKRLDKNIKDPSQNSIYSIDFVMEKIDFFIDILENKLLIEINLNDRIYSSAFEIYENYFINTFKFKFIVKRILIKEFLFYLLEIIKISNQILDKLRPEHIKLNLKLYLHLQRFLIDNSIDKFSLNELLNYSFFIENKTSPKKTTHSENDCLKSLNEIFQPFLLEFIKNQEDQFIKYMHNIYNIDKINDLVQEISNAINLNKINLNTATSQISNSNNPKRQKSYFDLKSLKKLTDFENYYSPSVTDLFTILHELLHTILQFDTKNSDLNLPHQLCFVNLIKNKLLTYATHVKNEFHKVYSPVSIHKVNKSISLSNKNSNLLLGTFEFNRSNSIQEYVNNSESPSNELTVLTCILVNNFEKIIQLLNDMELKLKNKSKLKKSVIDQLQSIKEILKEDLNTLIYDYSLEYKAAFTNSCYLIQLQLNDHDLVKKITNNQSNYNLFDNLIDEILFNILNDKLIICKTVLFDSLFKHVLIEIFKISISCIEESIILKNNLKLNTESNNLGVQNILNDSYNNYFVNKTNDIFTTMFKFFDVPANLKKNINDDQILINDLHYKVISQGIKHIIEFFSADEDFLNKEYLTQTAECQSAFKSLQLFLNSSSDLISKFIQSQNMQQNNIDFSKSFGKIKFSIECKQNVRLMNEIDFKMRIYEIRGLIPELNIPNEILSSGIKPRKILPNTCLPSVQVNLLGYDLNVKSNFKIFNCINIDLSTNSFLFNNDDLFEFKISVKRDQIIKMLNKNNFLDDYEIQFVVSDLNSPKEFNFIGIAVFNLSIAIESSDIWKKLIKEENLWDEFKNFKNINDNVLYGSIELWLSLRSRLKINEYGNKILKILDRHAKDKQAIEFIKLKLLSKAGKF